MALVLRLLLRDAASVQMQASDIDASRLHPAQRESRTGIQQPMSERSLADRVLPFALAFVAGFVDTCGFVALFGLFSAHVTGNFVLLGASLIRPHAGVIAKLLALPVFMAAVAGTRLFLIHAGSGTRSIRGVLAAEALCLGLFLACGVTASPIVDADAGLAILTGMFAVVAMGVQNAAARTVFVALSPTTVMTGNVTQIVLDGVDFVASPLAETKAAARARLAKLVPPVIAFAAGAALGAVGFGLTGFWCLVAPIAAIGLLLLFGVA
jgi:uncharacterized membrane protein YoaK (UPF0700 family)